MDDAVTLESDVLDTDLVVLLSVGYIVTVWKEGEKVFYRLTPKRKTSVTDQPLNK